MLNHTITTEILKAMTATVAKILHVTHGADIADCAQEACIRVLSKIDSFDPERGEFKSWACTIARNVALNWAVLKANRGHDSEGAVGDDGDTESLVDSLVGEDGRATVSRRADAAWLAKAIETLDDDDQMFVMGLAEGLDMGEAGALVGWSAVKTTRRYKVIVQDLAAEA